jgi:hypothetical protein
LWRDIPATRPSSQQLKKKVLKCKSFLLLRRLCYEYEHILEIGAQSPNISTITTSVLGGESSELGMLKAGEKRVDSYDPDECSICMDASIDIVLPCLHGYCSLCWEDWSSHSSTCPHCRGEIKYARDRVRVRVRVKTRTRTMSHHRGRGGGMMAVKTSGSMRVGMRATCRHN